MLVGIISVTHDKIVTGPFLGKSFGTSISPWIVTLDALEPFLDDGPPQFPEPLDYLKEVGKSAYNVNLEIQLRRRLTIFIFPGSLFLTSAANSSRSTH